MTGIKKILFPTDYSKFSNDAIEYAIAFTKEFKAKMSIMHVVEMSTHDPSNPLYKKPKLDEYTDVKDFIKARNKKQVVATKQSTDRFEYEEITIMGLSAGREIIRTIDKKKIDLLVIASHGAGFFEKILLGSTSEMVIKEAKCPVLVVKKKQRDFVDFKKDKINLNTILCPVDFSKFSGKSVEYAAFLAGHFGAKLTILHVIEEMFDSMDFLLEHFSISEFNEKREKGARKRMKQFLKKCLPPAIEHSEVYLHGNPKKIISEYAWKKKIDLVSIGAYGKGAEEGILFSGSIGMKIVYNTDCPVLIVR